MRNARVATVALLGLLITGVAYAADTSEKSSEEIAGPAQVEIFGPAPAEAQPAVADEVEAPAAVDAALDAAPDAAPDAALDAAPDAALDAAPHEGATAENVVRASVTTSIVDREPVDSVDTVTNEQELIFFFTEIADLSGGTITHRWEYNDEIMAEVPLEIGGSRWRTHSSKRLFKGWIGEWTVSVVDDSGQVLRSLSFNYVPSGTPASIDED